MYGIGSGTVVIVQETILSQWFQGRSLAAVIALMMTVSRLVSNTIYFINFSSTDTYALFFFSPLLLLKPL